MFRKFISVAAVTLAAASMLYAQNARIEGMGRTGRVVSDITGIMSFPGYMLDYPDIIQVTYDGSVGPLFGIKEINDQLTAGVYFNGSRVLNYDLYEFLVDQLYGTIGTLELAETDVDPIPHLLFGMDLNAAKLGFDVYFERAFYTAREIEIDDGAETKASIKGWFMNPGLLASLNMEKLRFALGASVPIARHSVVAESDAGTAEETAKSHRTVAATASGEFNADAAGLLWTAGLSFNMSMFTGEHETNPITGASVTTEYPSNLIIAPVVYAGFTKTLDEYGVLLALCGSASYKIDRTKPVDVTVTPAGLISTDDSLLLTANAGLEKTWDELKRLDAIYTRAGLTWLTGIGISRQNGEAANDEYHSRERTPAYHNAIRFPLGIGIRKSIFTLDVQIDPGCLINSFKLVNGQNVGTDFVRATLTADFGSGAISPKRSELPEPKAPAAETPAGDLNF